MIRVRADLHIHTVLSPCGDLDMSPANIIRIAAEKGLHIIGITDHNSTRQAGIVREWGKEQGVFVLTGVEITSSEEVHCLAFFEGDNELIEFQTYLDSHLPPIPNNPDKFGYQLVADKDDNIIYQEKKLLISALDRSIEEIERKVHGLNGIFIPAHIDKKRDSILSQLGFIPRGLNYDALEISKNVKYEDFIKTYPTLQNAAFIQSSDAHYPTEIGLTNSILEIEELSFEGIKAGILKGGIFENHIEKS